METKRAETISEVRHPCSVNSLYSWVVAGWVLLTNGFKLTLQANFYVKLNFIYIAPVHNKSYVITICRSGLDRPLSAFNLFKIPTLLSVFSVTVTMSWITIIPASAWCSLDCFSAHACSSFFYYHVHRIGFVCAMSDYVNAIQELNFSLSFSLLPVFLYSRCYFFLFKTKKKRKRSNTNVDGYHHGVDRRYKVVRPAPWCQ